MSFSKSSVVSTFQRSPTLREALDLLPQLPAIAVDRESEVDHSRSLTLEFRLKSILIVVFPLNQLQLLCEEASCSSIIRC